MGPAEEAKISPSLTRRFPDPITHKDSVSEIHEVHYVLKPQAEDIPSINTHSFTPIEEKKPAEREEILTLIGVLKENPSLTLNFLKGLKPGHLQASELELLRHMDLSFFKEVLRDENDSTREIKELGAELRGYLPQEARDNLFNSSKDSIGNKPTFSEVAHRIYTFIKSTFNSLVITLTPAETKPAIKKIRGEKIREEPAFTPLPEKTLKRKHTPETKVEVSEFISPPKKRKISAEQAYVYTKMGDLLTPDSPHRNTLYRLNRDKAVFSSKKLQLARDIVGNDEKNIETFLAISRNKEVSREDYQRLLQALDNSNLN